MSFREILPSSSPPQRHRSLHRGSSLPRVRVTNLASVETKNTRRSNFQARSRSVVLHGRVVPSAELQQQASEDSASVISIRDQWKRQSDFTRLSSNAKHFQKLVTDLETVLEDAGESPEAAWRAKILTKSAQETSESLWKDLYEYEGSLQQSNRNHPIPDIRTAQMACLKLHRDIKRTQKTFVMCLSKHERQQKADMSMLGAVGWSAPTHGNTTTTATTNDEDDTDLFDRTIRQREMERMNQSMHQVHDLYQELAGMVHEQQEKIDTVDAEIITAKQNVEAGAEQIHCGAVASNPMLWCGAAGEGVTCGGRTSAAAQGFDDSITLSDNDPPDGSGCQPLSPTVFLQTWQAVQGFHRGVMEDLGLWGNQKETPQEETPPAAVAASSCSSSESKGARHRRRRSRKQRSQKRSS